MRCIPALATSLLLVLTACARPLPQHVWSGPDEALATLRQRASGIRTLQSSARVILVRPGGETVHLDAALVASFPGRVRLRAWKLGHAVLDLTSTPEGLWLLAPPEKEGRDPEELSLTAAGFARAWSLFDPGFFSPPLARVRSPDEGPTLTIERHPDSGPPGATIRCEVDRATLTPRRYTAVDESGTPVSTLTLDQYRDFGGILWPTRIEAVARVGRVVVFAESPRFNEDVAAGAFTPPTGAVKQP